MNNKRWIDILQNLLDECNFKDKHRTIGMTPSEVKRSNENNILNKFYEHAMNKKCTVKFRFGDRVRLPYYKYTFGNKYDENWTRQIFVVTKMLNTRPMTYKIKELTGKREEVIGSFYNEELQKTAF